ncbi:DUF368 domain-containing protein [Saccharospirillum mangrovi]|uniref:DUF368 domain-containing protein n=1 Tax=Saccharospirillum mangrovi TaxID=2161747 RepID=UPI000D3BF2A9|nr:DUF368 domain-containing protein [Saccharospirillum mangrovi]
MKQRLIWFAKGAVMGMADAVPGVSGGTMALITGIYERLIAALAAVRIDTARQALQGDWAGAWRKLDGNFLLSLGLGILLSLFTTLHVMHLLLEQAPQLVWAFFGGLILASLVVLMRRHHWQWIDVPLMTVGALLAVGIALSSALNLPPTPVWLVLGGALAISAMLLPGISGSFILLLLGLYPAVVEAISDMNLIIVAWVALGCLLGLLAFSRLLNALLARWHDRVLGFMLGFVLGALLKVWPWQAQEQWLSPQAFEAMTGQPAWTGACVLLALLGAAAVAVVTLKSPS